MSKDKEKVACQYCGKEYSPKGIPNHEASCAKNPKNMETPEDKEKAKWEKVRLGYGSVKDMPLRKQIAIANKSKTELTKYYKQQEKQEVRISSMYQPYFGKAMPVSLNGVLIYIPCDNERYEIPKSFAREVEARIRRVEDQRQREKRMSDVKSNFDGQRAGSLDLVKAL